MMIVSDDDDSLSSVRDPIARHYATSLQPHSNVRIPQVRTGPASTARSRFRLRQMELRRLLNFRPNQIYGRAGVATGVPIPTLALPAPVIVASAPALAAIAPPRLVRASVLPHPSRALGAVAMGGRNAVQGGINSVHRRELGGVRQAIARANVIHQYTPPLINAQVDVVHNAVPVTNNTVQVDATVVPSDQLNQLPIAPPVDIIEAEVILSPPSSR